MFPIFPFVKNHSKLLARFKEFMLLSKKDTYSPVIIGGPGCRLKLWEMLADILNKFLKKEDFQRWLMSLPNRV